MSGEWGHQVSGRQVLREVKQQLATFQEVLKRKGTKVAIIHFEAPGEATDVNLRTRLKAAGVSTRAKLKTFRDLGVEPLEILKPWRLSEADFVATLSELNEDSSVAGIIVQHPMMPEISRNLYRIAPEKDLDTLTIRTESLFPTPATSEAILRTAAAFSPSEAIVRTAAPYMDDHPLIAVVGARGFVGRGVVAQFQAQGTAILALDARDPGFTPDDLLQVTEADIVISAVGQPEILDERHLRPHHRIVIDCGFSPIGEEIFGDVKKSAYSIPQNITPVPGGIGPTEMAILAERLVQKEVAPDLENWALAKRSYLSRAEVAEIQQQWASDIRPTVAQMLTLSSDRNEVEGNHYRVTLDEEANALSLYSKDGRGLLVEYRQNAGSVEITNNNLSAKDMAAWQQIQQIFNQQVARTQQPDIEL